MALLWHAREWSNDDMSRSSKKIPLSLDERTSTILYVRWQALRNRNDYKNAAEECLRNLRALYNQLIAQQQTLASPPTLSTSASALATEIDQMLQRTSPKLGLALRQTTRKEKHLLLLDLFLDNEGVLRTLPAEAQRAVMLELVTYWDWEDTNWLLNRRIAALEDLAHTLEIATDVFCSGDPSLESLPTQSLTHGQLILGKFTGLCSKLCKPDFLQQFPPLATLRQRWHILLPLDPGISALPARAAYAVFPDIVPHRTTRIYRRTESRPTSTITMSPRASLTSVLAEVNALLPAAASRLQSFPYYARAFRVYELKRNGTSYPAIAQQVLSEEFKMIKGPHNYKNLEYKKVIQMAKDLFTLLCPTAKNGIKS
jgi:hypothetical protein